MSADTTRATTKRAGPSGNGQRTRAEFRLESPRRRVEVPQLLIAVFLVAVSALAAVVLFSRAAARTPVLALAHTVERGEALGSDDLMIAYVATDDPISTVSPDDAPTLVGLTAVADLDAGTIVTPAHFVSRSLLEAGEAVVGMALAPGEYPTFLLAPGDQVDVVLTDRTSTEGDTTAGAILASAEVFDMVELGTQGERFVSLRLPAQDATRVAAAASAGDVRLILVNGLDR